jgi:hypothetical protein
MSQILAAHQVTLSPSPRCFSPFSLRHRLVPRSPFSSQRYTIFSQTSGFIPSSILCVLGFPLWWPPSQSTSTLNRLSMVRSPNSQLLIEANLRTKRFEPGVPVCAPQFSSLFEPSFPPCGPCGPRATRSVSLPSDSFVASWLCVIQLGSPLPFVPRLPMGRDGPHYNCKASVTELGYRFKQRRNSSASTRTWGSSIKVT